AGEVAKFSQSPFRRRSCQNPRVTYNAICISSYRRNAYNWVMRVRAVHLLMMLAAAMMLIAAGPATAPNENPSHDKTPVAVVALSGHVDDYTRDVLKRRFASARAAGAQTIIVKLDTYGGLVTSALDISRFIKSQRDIHTIA